MENQKLVVMTEIEYRSLRENLTNIMAGIGVTLTNLNKLQVADAVPEKQKEDKEEDKSEDLELLKE